METKPPSGHLGIQAGGFHPGVPWEKTARPRGTRQLDAPDLRFGGPRSSRQKLNFTGRGYLTELRRAGQFRGVIVSP